MINIKSFSVIDANNIKGNIHIVGCGALGSKMAVELIRLNLLSKMIGYDFDHVEAKNLNNQAFFRQHIGMPKVEALKDLAAMIDIDAVLRIKNKKVDFIRTKSTDIVILALDSYTARASILENIEGEPLVIIGGANARGGNIEVLRGDYAVAAAEYRESQDTPEYDEDDLTACGSPISISHRLNGVATIMCEQLIQEHNTEGALSKNIIFEVTENLLIKLG